MRGNARASVLCEADAITDHVDTANAGLVGNKYTVQYVVKQGWDDGFRITYH